MSRPLRIEFPGAVYHVTSRGDRQEAIFDDDSDRRLFLRVLAQGLERLDAKLLAYCLMGNHYHLVLVTNRANLSALMRHINGVYTQSYNFGHGKGGHLFQGRFKAILVDRDSYLLEVCRYVDLNPVRAGLVREPEQWAWSSYRAHVGQVAAPPWLDTASLHAQLLGQDITTQAQARKAELAYTKHVAAGKEVRLWDASLRQQIYLGDDAFVQRAQAAAAPNKIAAKSVPKTQRRTQKSLKECLAQSESRDHGIWTAHTQLGLSMTAIGEAMGLTVGRISQVVKRIEDSRIKT